MGSNRVFACAYDWPGWCRSGKDEASALAALATYAPRYAPVARLARIPFEDGRAATRAFRKAIADVLGTPSKGGPRGEKGWPRRYGARRIAWHALDHAGEIEDRSAPAGGR